MRTLTTLAERPLEILRSKFSNCRKIGFLRAFRITYDRLALKILERIFRFHPWHSEAPTSARPYRYVIAHMVNGLAPTTVVEIGCGLGENLALINAPRRYGYDLDEGVIRAARFLNGRAIQFEVGSFSDVRADAIDVLVLVNWIHEISPLELEAQLAPLLSRTRFLVTDAIDQDGPIGYRFKHDFKFLEPTCIHLSSTRPENEGRSFHLFGVRS